MKTMRAIIESAIEDLDERARDEDGLRDLSDVVHEIADSHVPVYTRELWELALDDLDLCMSEPELGPAFDGRPTPLNLLAANVYEAVSNALSERCCELEREARYCDHCRNKYAPSLVAPQDGRTGESFDEGCFCSRQCEVDEVRDQEEADEAREQEAADDQGD